MRRPDAATSAAMSASFATCSSAAARLACSLRRSGARILTLHGEPAAFRETFAQVNACCAAYDEARGHARTRGIINSWGDELDLFQS